MTITDRYIWVKRVHFAFPRFPNLLITTWNTEFANNPPSRTQEARTAHPTYHRDQAQLASLPKLSSGTQPGERDKVSILSLPLPQERPRVAVPVVSDPAMQRQSSISHRVIARRRGWWGGEEVSSRTFGIVRVAFCRITC